MKRSCSARRPASLPSLLCRLCVLCASVEAGPVAAQTLDLAVLPPGCLEPWQRVLLLPTLVQAALEAQGASASIAQSGLDALSEGGHLYFPRGEAEADALWQRPSGLADLGRAEVIETPFERIYVEAPLAGLDLLALVESVAAQDPGRFPDLSRRQVPLLGNERALALALETPRGASEEHPGARESFLRLRVAWGGAQGSLVAISRSLGGPARLHASLAASPPDLLLHPGGAAGEVCEAALAELAVHARVPRAAELRQGAQGPAGLAANLVPRGEGAAADALGGGVQVHEVRGVRIALVGLVGLAEYARADAAFRARTRFRPGRDALADAIAQLRRAQGGPPDAIVALSSGDATERAQLAAVDGLDLVIADFSRDDGLPWSTTLTPLRAREESRHNAALSPVFHRAGLGRIRVSFAPPAPGRRRTLERIEVVIDPLLDAGEPPAASLAFAAPFRRAAQQALRRDARRLLPALQDIAARDEARPLIWGEGIALLGDVRRRGEGTVPLWTDDLWLRAVANLLAREQRADVSFVQNMGRAPLVAGPLTRGVAAAWLHDTENAALYAFRGAELLTLAERMGAHATELSDASRRIGVSGLDLARRRARGRPIDAAAHYRVVVDERLRNDPRFAGLGRALGEPFSLPATVLAGLARGDALASAFEDRARAPVPEWKLGIQNLELRGSAIRVSEGLSDLAPSREARAQGRDLWTASTRVHAYLLHDGGDLTWDNQLRAQYDVTWFADPGEGPPFIEPLDDVLLSSELRWTALRWSSRDDVPTLSSYASITADSEFTPLPGTERQALLRESAGGVLFGSGWLREARGGVLWQQDAARVLEPGISGAGTFATDVGFLGVVRVQVPLTSALTFESTQEIRYFLPFDSERRPFDLALRAQSQSRLSTPLAPGSQGFVFLDAIGLTPKKTPWALEWNVLFGAGVAFSAVTRLPTGTSP